MLVLSPSVLGTMCLELCTPFRARREPEPDLIMDDPASVAAFERAFTEDGVMAPTYHFNAAHAAEVIRPGDTVLDLGCGPATQLAVIAKLCPDACFIGVDLSEEMLVRAEKNVAHLPNVELQRGDITKLDFMEDNGAQAVISTVALHHLPTTEALEQCFAEVARVLAPGGGVYLVDFSLLRSRAAMRRFAYQHASRQMPAFTQDYLHSLGAAFPRKTMERMVRTHLHGRARLFGTFGIQFMVAIKSPPRCPRVQEKAVVLDRTRETFLPHQHRDLRDFTTAFRLGGLASPLLAEV